MRSQQPKCAKKGSERYLMVGPNHILVMLWGGMKNIPLVTKMCVSGS